MKTYLILTALILSPSAFAGSATQLMCAGSGIYSDLGQDVTKAVSGFENIGMSETVAQNVVELKDGNVLIKVSPRYFSGQIGIITVNIYKDKGLKISSVAAANMVSFRDETGGISCILQEKK